MSRRQLVDAFVAGRISRRVFIKKLVKAGVTVGAAVTFASVLTPASAGDALHPDHYDHYHHDPHHPPTHPPQDPHHPSGPHGAVSSAQKAVQDLLGRLTR